MEKSLTIRFPAALWAEIEAIQAERPLENITAATVVRQLVAEAVTARKASDKK